MAVEQKKERKPILGWRGALSEANSMMRLMVFVVSAVASVSLTFMQLGFVWVDFGGSPAYLFVLLQLVAVVALVLGVRYGFLLGLIAGAALCIHAMLQPLDYYEFSFITPLTSIGLLTIWGLLLGLLFAFALRNNPTRLKRAIYIVIICVVVSLCYSISFVACVFIQTVTELANAFEAVGATAESNIINVRVMESLSRLGNLSVQFGGDALLMIALCHVGDVATRKVVRAKGDLMLHSLVSIWLSIVVLIVFLVAEAVGFVAISEGQRLDAGESMKREASYLCSQLEDSRARGDALLQLLDDVDFDWNLVGDKTTSERLSTIYSSEGVMAGYENEAEEMLVVAYEDGTVLMSNIKGLEVGDELLSLGTGVYKAIEKSRKTGELQRAVYGDAVFSTFTDEDIENADLDAITRDTEIVYVYAQETVEDIVVLMRRANVVYAHRGGVMAGTTAAAFALFLVLFILVQRLMDRLVVGRINETNEVLGRIVDGDLDARVTVRGTREFKSLSADINKTVDTMKEWITEAETRMDAELATAKAIQESALPRIFPPYPDISRFDIYASMKPAREVGGDFYDFFLIEGSDAADSSKLGFVIADVSGKGVPAALFMMKAKTQIRDYLASGMEIGEAIENANRQLCDGNDAGMFVTAWIGVLDYATGHVDYVNAGHNPPLLWTSGLGPEEDAAPVYKWRWLTEHSGLPLGLFDGLPYQPYSLECRVGDQFLLYTDGVTEAMDVDGTLYGEDRLETLVNKDVSLHPRELVDAVRNDVAHHAEGAEQSDDITIQSLEVGVPPEITATLVLPALPSELSRVNAFIHSELDRRLCPMRAQIQLDVAVEELFVNVCHYAYPDATPEAPGMVRVSYTYSAEPPSIQVDIADDGVFYDPMAKPDAVTPDDIMDVPIGGLGILMAKRSVDEMRYERIDGSNVTTIIKKW